MATILTRKRRDGSVAYQAQLVIKRDGAIVHREQRTFDRKQAAYAWAEKREADLARPGALTVVQGADPTLAAAIDRYISELSTIGRTKSQVLRTLKTKPLALMACSTIGSHHIVELANDLKVTMTPQTVMSYLAHLSSIFTIAQPAWGVALDRNAMRDALMVCKRMGITGKSNERDRRPTLIELDKIMTYFEGRRERYPRMMPMAKLIAFALYSTRRQDEITRIEWRDLDVDASRVLVRDMKNPGEKIGNHVWCDLTPEALNVIKSMPRSNDIIFPFESRSISANFTRAGAKLKINDLHFHDLRHEGISRLLEKGYTIPQAASVSGHKTWTSLQRYSHLRMAGDKWADWKWLSRVTKGAS